MVPHPLRESPSTIPDRVQGSKLTLGNLQNAGDFDNLRVRKLCTSKRLRVGIIHVSQTFGESCSNARSKQ